MSWITESDTYAIGISNPPMIRHRLRVSRHAPARPMARKQFERINRVLEQFVTQWRGSRSQQFATSAKPEVCPIQLGRFSFLVAGW